MGLRSELWCAVLSGCALVLGGCPSFSSQLSPRPTPVGLTDLNAGLNMSYYALAERDDGAAKNVLGQRAPTRMVATFDLTVRHGLSEHVDIGAKLTMFSAELSSRILLAGGGRGGAGTTRYTGGEVGEGGIVPGSEMWQEPGTVDVAVVPAVGLAWATMVESSPNVLAMTAGAPLLFGIGIVKGVSLVTGPKFAAAVAVNAESSEEMGGVTLLPGAVLGAELRLSEAFAFFPEVTVAAPYSMGIGKFRRTMWGGGIGFQFRLF